MSNPNIFDPYSAPPGETGDEWLDPNHLFEVTLPDGTVTHVTMAQLNALPEAPAAPKPKPAQQVASAAQPVASAVTGGLIHDAIAPTAGLPPAAPVMTDATGAPLGSATPSAVPSLLSAAPGSMGASFLPYAGVAAGAATGEQQAGGIMNALKNKDLSFTQQAALALPTFGTSFLYNPIKNFFGSGKDADQQGRDQVRQSLLDKGFIDGNYNLQTNDGRDFNLGLDGGAMVNGDHPYNVDFSKANAGQAVAWLQPLGMLITGGQNQKLASNFVGELFNAVYSDDPATLKNNIAALYQKYGVSPDQMDQFIDSLKLDNQTKQIYKQNNDSLTRVNDYGIIGQNQAQTTPPITKDPNVHIHVNPAAAPAPQQAAPPPPPSAPKNLNQAASIVAQRPVNPPEQKGTGWRT